MLQLLRSFRLVVPTRRYGSGEVNSTSDVHSGRLLDCWRSQPPVRLHKHRLISTLLMSVRYVTNEAQLTASRPLGMQICVPKTWSDPIIRSQEYMSCVTCSFSPGNASTLLQSQAKHGHGSSPRLYKQVGGHISIGSQTKPCNAQATILLLIIFVHAFACSCA